MPIGDPELEDPFAKYGEQAMEMLTPEGEDIFPSGFKSASSMTKRLYIVAPFASLNSKSMNKGALKNLKVNSSLSQGLKNSAASRIMGSRVTSPFALSPKKTEALKIKAAQEAFKTIVIRNNMGGYSKDSQRTTKINFGGLKVTKNNTSDAGTASISNTPQD